jgi:dTDP-4-amino-4,6-dideoxygalactose transaminase
MQNQTDTLSDDATALTPAEHWPFYAEDEISAVVSTLRSGKVNQWTGTKVVEFQEAHAAYVGRGRAIALANGSVALELAVRAYDIGPGDEVIVTPRTFVASAYCVLLVGATPVFADVDRDSGNITPETIAAAITPRTKAVIPVHLGGWPCDMPAIMDLAREHDLLVIEDCAQAHGAEIDGRPVGSFAETAAFSFCQDKILSTGGEGGLTMFADDERYEWAWSFKDHGKNRRRMAEPATEPGFRWVHDSVGTNWRMLETSAAIGLLQLSKLNEWRNTRARNAAIWSEELSAVSQLRIPAPPSGWTHANYQFYAYLDEVADPEAARTRLLRELSELGIRAFSGSCSEVYREAGFDWDGTRLPIARELGETSVMFEVHPTLDPRRLRARAAQVAEVAARVL